MQFSNYVLPFLVIPLLTRALGVDGFGKYAFYLGVANLLLVFIRFGFEFSATRSISIHSTNKDKIIEIVSSVLVIKLLLLIFAVMIFSFIVIFAKPDPQITMLLLGGGLLLTGQMLLPVWYFQGIQQMKFVTLYTVVTKIFYVGLLFFLISEKQDYGKATFVYGFSFFVAGIVSAVHMLYQLNFKFVTSKASIKETFKDALPFFTSRVFVMTYTSSMIPLIGFIGTPAQAAIYAASEKLYNAAQSVMYPITNALYPHVAKNKDLVLFKKLFVLSLFLVIVGCLLAYFLAPYLIVFLFGQDFKASAEIFNIHTIALLFVFPSMMLGFPLLAALGFSKEANSVVIVGALVFFAIAGYGVFSGIIKTEFFVWGVVAAEVTVFTLRAYFAVNRIWIKKLHIAEPS